MSHRSSRNRSEPKGEVKEDKETGRLIRARTAQEVGEVAGYLETLAQALRAGGVTIRRGQEMASLRVGEQVQMKLEAGEEGGESVLKLELRWETPEAEEPLEITASGPAPEAPTGGGTNKPAGRPPRQPAPSENA